MRKNKGQTRKRAYVENGESYIRSRTISGYDPSSGNEEKNIELEHVQEQKKNVRKKRRRVAVFLGLILLGIIIFAFSQVAVVVTDVEYSSSAINRERDEDYLVVATQYLVDHPSERFSWSRKNDLLTEHIQSNYPEVADAQIRGLFGAGKLYLEIRQPVAVWKTNTTSRFVDKNGVVFEKNYYKDPDITINDQSGSGAVSQRFLQFIGKIISGVESNGLGKVEKVAIPSNAIRYVEITISGHNFPVKIQTDRDAESQVTDIVNMIKYLDNNKITPNYVDARIKNRGFWK